MSVIGITYTYIVYVYNLRYTCDIMNEFSDGRKEYLNEYGLASSVHARTLTNLDVLVSSKDNIHAHCVYVCVELKNKQKSDYIYP